MENINDRIGVCSWSLQPENPADLASKVKATGTSRIQLGLDPLCQDTEWENGQQVLADEGIAIISGMFHTIGEDYTTPQTIRQTGGVVPDEHWDANLSNIRQVAAKAGQLGLELVSGHAGFIPTDSTAPLFQTLVSRIREIADIFSDQFGGTLILETGQESASTLQTFLETVDRDNVGINFDPANMLLYNMGDPIEALQMLVPNVKQVHMKDGISPEQDGQWGTEVTVGTGQVDWNGFLSILENNGFAGSMMFEREAGDDRVGDIVKGMEYIRSIAS